MSSGYIYNPPPPPPPRATASSGPQNSYPSQRGGRGRGGRGNRGGNSNPRTGHNSSRGAVSSTRGGADNTWHGNGSSGSRPPPPQTHQWLGPSSPLPARNVHLNPAFFSGLQAPHVRATSSQAPPQATQLPSSNLFYSAPLPSPVFYGDLASKTASSPGSTAPPVPTSYSHYAPPTSTDTWDARPSNKRPRLETHSRPDMTEADWLALNGGKLIGTDILPPTTDEEVAAWIAERKKRFPLKATQAEREKERTEMEHRKKEANREHWRMKNEMQQAEEEDRKKKEQAIEERKARLKMEKEAGNVREATVVEDEKESDDGPPEEISGKTRTAMRDDRRKGRGKSQKLCKEFQQKGRCSRGAQCWLSHKVKERNEAAKAKENRKSLYQRFIENDRGHDNELLVKVIKYLEQHGLLDNPTNEGPCMSET